jgi:glucose-6-phosphate 1-dehydrogenase
MLTADQVLPESVATASQKIAEPFSLVIFGASGDLTARKLVPALFSLFIENRLPDKFEIIGFARREKTNEDFRKEMFEGVQKYSRWAPVKEDQWEAFAQHLSYHIGNFDDAQTYKELGDNLDKIEITQTGTQRLFYFATAPEFFSEIAKFLNKAGLIGHHKTNARVVIEKPFGQDYASAQKLINDLHECIDESSVFRIDHYLGKETVQNLLYFRFANSIYEPVWNHNMVDHIQITLAEQEGVGKRGGYYDGIGAIRDMMQNHVMQLLALVAMEPPSSVGAEALRNEKVKVIQSILTPDHEKAAAMSVRAQYDGYLKEDRVDPNSKTETYTAVKFHIDNWRWAGVPFYLRTGKMLKSKASEIIIIFKRPPTALFQNASESLLLPQNRIHIRLQPQEGIHFVFNVKRPGEKFLEPADMDFAYKTKFGSYSPEAYERLLRDAIIGDPTLFTRADEVLEGWRLMDAIRTSWEKAPVHQYKAGSWGPKAADDLLAQEGHHWIEPGI